MASRQEIVEAKVDILEKKFKKAKKDLDKKINLSFYTADEEDFEKAEKLKYSEVAKMKKVMDDVSDLISTSKDVNLSSAGAFRVLTQSNKYYGKALAAYSADSVAELDLFTTFTGNHKDVAKLKAYVSSRVADERREEKRDTANKGVGDAIPSYKLPAPEAALLAAPADVLAKLGLVKVPGYTRKDGTTVKAYFRKLK